MIRLGEIQTLKILRKTSVGAFLNEKVAGQDDILLPKRQVTEEMQPEDVVEVFVYKDSEDRIIATTTKPQITLGNIALLRVAEVTKIGAFLEWGLEKDLLLPYKEQKTPVKKGEKYLVALYLDKSERLCATTKIYDYLRSDSEYKQGDKVTGTIYSIKDEFGAFVAVDNKYHGLISKHELYGKYNCFDTIEARVLKVREDGKLDLSIRQPSYLQMDKDSQDILEKIDDNYGELKLNDSSSPEEIKEVLNMSKGSFKRAIGKLLKEKKIDFTENGIKRI